jgi:hypothetical protein
VRSVVTPAKAGVQVHRIKSEIENPGFRLSREWRCIRLGEAGPGEWLPIL